MSSGLRRCKLSRRHVLTGLGGIAVGLPWLEKLNGHARAQAKPERAKRMIMVTYAMGVPGFAWRPSATGQAFTFPYVTAPLEPFRDRCLLVSNVDNSVLDEGGDSFIYGHPAKAEAALTGTLTTGAFPGDNTNSLSELLANRETTGGANGPSVDHIAGQFLRKNHAFPSIDLAVNGEAVAYPVPATMDSQFFFEGRANPVSLMAYPHQAFSSVFSGVMPDAGPSDADLALRALRLRNKSVLDAVRSGFNDLKQGLGREDKRRLEEHAALIRQLEIDVQVAAGCTVPTGIQDRGNLQGLDMPALTDPMLRILTHAMACDLAPIGRLDFTGQQSPRFGIASLDTLLDGFTGDYDWHALVHGDPFPNTTGGLRPGRDGATQYDSNLLAGYRFFVQQFANLLAALDAIPEGPETSVLDHSLVVLASDLGEGLGHAHMKMGYVLAGNLGGVPAGHFDAGPTNVPYGIGGEYFYAPSRYNVNQLLHSMLDMVGVVDGQGRPVNMGLNGFLEKHGRSRRIDPWFG